MALTDEEKAGWRVRLMTRVRELRTRYEELIDESDEYDEMEVGGKHDQLREQAERVKEELALSVISMADILIEWEAELEAWHTLDEPLKFPKLPHYTITMKVTYKGKMSPRLRSSTDDVEVD